MTLDLRHRAYAAALKVMFQIPPERIHGIIMSALRVMQKVGPVRTAVSKIFPVRDPILAQELFGLRFERPLGLAAGFDKAAEVADVWEACGFGYAELGTVTAKGQPGNPAPRLYRLPADKALLNRMGFNNPGAAAAAANLKARRGAGVIAINIGKTKVTPAEEAVDDYRTSAHLLGHLADYVVVNVSSPNTPGLRDLQAVEALRPILAAVQEETDTPVMVKIAPDLSDEDVDAVADLALELGLAGVVATNTTISRDNLKTDPDEVAAMGAGGISGPPLAARALEVLERLHARLADSDVVLVASGGIFTAEEAWARIAAGASLLQGYTGMIYGGPDWIRDIHRGLAEQLRRQGMNNIAEAVGCRKAWLAA